MLCNLFLLNSLLDSGLKGIGVSTNNLLDLLSILEDHECGHGSNTELLGDIWDLIDVNLDEVGASVGVGESVTTVSSLLPSEMGTDMKGREERTRRPWGRWPCKVRTRLRIWFMLAAVFSN